MGIALLILTVVAAAVTRLAGLGIARGVATPGYPALWSVVENRLYLFYAAEAQKIFLADPRAAVAAADARWPAVMKDLPE